MGRGQRANRSADAASEVMGHILLVAAIALFAFGMAAGVTRTVAIAVSAHQQSDDIVLTYMGGEDSPSLSLFDVSGTAMSASFPAPPAVSNTLTIPGAGNAGSDHVVVVAELVDGSRQVALDVVV